MILTCIRRDCGENLPSPTMNDVTDAERSEWRWRLTRKRIEVLDAKRREYCCGGALYALGKTAYKVVCAEREVWKADQLEWEEVGQVTRVFIRNKRRSCYAHSLAVCRQLPNTAKVESVSMETNVPCTL